LIKKLYRLAATLRKIYWFVFRPRTSGVKCVIECDGQWLMIRNSYGRGHWTFPGGAVDRGESPVSAALREVEEEVGIVLTDVHPIGSYFSNNEYKRDTVHCFHAKVDDDAHTIDEAEVAEAAWFAPRSIPDFRGPAVERIVAMMNA
jgi:8-oxo-dGTP pyrophosphatase MutT (NUDIX family)